MIETQQEATLGIGAVARRTGLSPDVLRVWERRHGVVTPVRTDGGTRLYTESQVRRLELLSGLVSRGHRIGTLARLDEVALIGLLMVEDASSPRPDRSIRPVSGLGEGASPALIERVIAALEEIDSATVEALLTPAFLALGPRSFTLELALPLLREVGTRWAAGALSIAAEHAVAAVVRSLLGGAIRRHPERHRSHRAVFATPSGQHHELGVLAAALLASGAGVDPVYLGPDVPASEVASTARRTGAGIVVIGLADPATPDCDWGAYLADLRTALRDDVELWVGGPGSASASARVGATALPSLEALERRLDERRLAGASPRADGPVPPRAPDAGSGAERSGDLLAELVALHQEIDQTASVLAARHADRLHCRRGCAGCCVDDLTVRPIEAEWIRRRHPELLREGRPHPRGGCAFLDESGACRIYTDRPSVCRSQGLPLRFHYEDEAGRIVERRDICSLNLEGGPPLESLDEGDCWLVGPVELRLASLDARFLEANGRAAEVPEDPRVALRSLFHRDGAHAGGEGQGSGAPSRS